LLRLLPVHFSALIFDYDESSVLKFFAKFLSFVASDWAIVVGVVALSDCAIVDCIRVFQCVKTSNRIFHNSLIHVALYILLCEHYGLKGGEKGK